MFIGYDSFKNYSTKNSNYYYQSKKWTVFATVNRIQRENIVVKILQGSVVTQTMLGGLSIYPRVANFLQCICAKNYEKWLTLDKVIAKTRYMFKGTQSLSNASISNNYEYHKACFL